MVDKSWSIEQEDQPFTYAENLAESTITEPTRAILVNDLNTDGVTINLKFKDNAGVIAVPLNQGEIYPFCITSWSKASATSAEIWGLW